MNGDPGASDATADSRLNNIGDVVLTLHNLNAWMVERLGAGPTTQRK